MSGGGRIARRLRREGAYLAFIFFMLFATSIAVVVALVSIQRIEIETATILSIAALALFASIIGGLTQAMSEPNEREAALITFLVTASGMTLAGVGSAFWGIVAGMLTLAVLNWGKR